MMRFDPLKFRGVVIDSRKVTPGCLFAALPGAKADGHAFEFIDALEGDDELDGATVPEPVIVGEIGLSGEIRAVNNIESRIKEAQKLGFKTAIIPKYSKNHKFPEGIEIHCVSKLFDAITTALNGN